MRVPDLSGHSLVVQNVGEIRCCFNEGFRPGAVKVICAYDPYAPVISPAQLGRERAALAR